jgi:capsule polysaccharide export protein KpsE/RkpR
MFDVPDLTSIEQITPQELTEIITELEQYRERLVKDTLSMAQRAKVMKAQAIASLESNLTKIDTTLETLRDRQATLTSGN